METSLVMFKMYVHSLIMVNSSKMTARAEEALEPRISGENLGSDMKKKDSKQ